ncbi:MAG: sigma-54 dependent transcriptional regulator [Pseudomonadota bacterium]
MIAPRRIAVVDDDREMRESLRHLLEAAGWRVDVPPSAEALIERVAADPPDVILSDMRMPGMDGMALLEALGAGAPPVVLISAHGDIPIAVEAMSKGAYSFIEKPYDPRRLLHVLGNAADRRRAEMEALRLKRRLADLSGLDRVLMGDSPAIRAVREEIEDLAATDLPVLLIGETGTGKDLVARALHDISPRAAKPFIGVSCAALRADRLSPLGRADGGALYLDSVSAASAEAQAALSRALETKRFANDDGEEQATDFRVISAIGEPVEAALAAGRLREDLLFRIDAASVTLPPLRDRREDAPLLYDHFVAACAETYETDAPETTAEDLAALMAHDWPGNVRELRHVAERRVLAARRGRGSAAEAIRMDDGGDAPGTLREAVAALERRMIARALKAQDGRMDDVAAELGIGRRTLNEKIVKLGLDKRSLL